MSDIPADLLYSEEHEYLKESGEEGVYYVGITDYGQGELGDIVSVKAVSDLFSPVSCEVVETNDALDRDPSLVNSDPYGEGWMIKVRISDPGELDQLLGAAEYKAHIGA